MGPGAVAPLAVLVVEGKPLVHLSHPLPGPPGDEGGREAARRHLAPAVELTEVEVTHGDVRAPRPALDVVAEAVQEARRAHEPQLGGHRSARGVGLGHRDQLRHGVGLEGDVLVEDEEVLAPCLGHAPVDAPGQGEARVEAHEPHSGVLASHPRGRVVPRAVVDDDHLERPPGLGGERGKKALEPAHPVVGDHHGRDERAGRLLPRARRGGRRPGLGAPEPLEQARFREAGQGGARRCRRRGRGAESVQCGLEITPVDRAKSLDERLVEDDAAALGGQCDGARQEPDPGGDPIGEAQGRGCYPRPARAFPLHSLRVRP